MPTPKLHFQEQNHQNPEHSIIFKNTSANISQHLWNKSSYQILRENWRAIHCVPPLLIPCSWERCLLITLDSASSIISQQYCELQNSHSVTFLINSDKRPLLIVCFLKHLEMSPFHWRRFCKFAINRLCHDFPWTRNFFTNGALIPKIYSTWSFADVMLSSGNFFFASCLSRMQRALPRADLHISIFRACATCPNVALVSSSTNTSATLWENRKGSVCLLLLFHEW